MAGGWLIIFNNEQPIRKIRQLYPQQEVAARQWQVRHGLERLPNRQGLEGGIPRGCCH
jgi:hypothetical protein